LRCAKAGLSLMGQSAGVMEWWSNGVGMGIFSRTARRVSLQSHLPLAWTKGGPYPRSQQAIHETSGLDVYSPKQ
jgi:hypothetical protein